MSGELNFCFWEEAEEHGSERFVEVEGVVVKSSGSGVTLPGFKV